MRTPIQNPGLRRACALGLVLLACGAAAAGKPEKPHETVPASSDLTEEDNAAIRQLFDQLAQKFLAGDAKGCQELVAQTAEDRERILNNLEKEFNQSTYLEFTILDIQPDDTVKEKKQHSVDARISYKIKRPAPDKEDVENTVSHTFFLQKLNDKFLFVSSSFFDGLGLRQGIWVMVGRTLLAAILGVALLAFWIWMGWEAYRARPRRVVWRLIVLVPFAGALAFFLAVYLPAMFRAGAPGAKS